MFKITLYFFSCFVLCWCTGSIVTPCKLTDNACMIHSAQAVLPLVAAGIPDRGIPAADPLVLEDVRVDDGVLELQFKNMKVARVGECKFDSVEANLEQNHLKFVMECPIRVTGQYNVRGKLMVIPITGNGDFEIKTEKIKLTVDANLKTIKGADGKSRWTIVSYEHEYVPIEQVYFRFDNLFGGDEEKAKPVMEVLNNSWKEVIQTIGKPVIKVIIDQAKVVSNDFLNAFTADELFLS